MKARLKDRSAGFTPFELTLTIESENEASVIYSVFNHSDITDVMDNYSIDSEQVRDLVEEGCAAPIHYQDVFKELDDNFKKRS